MEEFKQSIIPANYYITKSMEFTKKGVSGTLWYLKKYIVLYNAIFLEDTISTEEGINNIIKIFNEFIESLPEESREDATKCFYPDGADIRGNYNKFVHFKGNKMFTNRKDENDYMDHVRKYYFVYLMQIGGQNGVKQYIRNYLYQEDFTMEKLEGIIEEYLREHSDNKYNVNQIKNDYHSSLRNERQILWYYGFVHSKSAGSVDMEFSSLTPIGETAIKANYDEFRMIWEHQKLKMISQPVTVQISEIKENPYADGRKFAINYSPYITILDYLSSRGRISKAEYQFIVSRINNKNSEMVEENLEDIINKIEEIKEHVKKFSRRSDIKANDFDKEIKKYILGLRADLRKDYSKNKFGVCKFRNGVILEDSEKLNKILKIYRLIDEYKLNKHNELFNKCENELRQKYIQESKGNEYTINPKVKIRWDLYNIHFDKTITIALILLDYMLKNDLEMGDIIIDNELIKTLKDTYPSLFKVCNLTTKAEITSKIRTTINGLKNGKIEDLNYDDTQYEDIYTNEYTSLSVQDLEAKIIRTSKENDPYVRIRNMSLIALIKQLYNTKYSDEQKLIKCECCGKTTFLTDRDEAYLEFHHLLPFNIVDGPDHYINIFGLCPDCHRRMHHGNDLLKPQIYANLNINNHKRKTILEIFKEMYEQRILKSYQLEYALAEHMINENEYNQIIA